MSDAQAPETTQEPVAPEPELNDLVKVTFLGSSDPREQNGHIKLADGPLGEPRGLTLGGAKEGDPPDALVTPEELHMLTSKFQVEVAEEQPTLSPEEIQAQKPEDVSVGSGVPVTMPLDESGNPIEPPPEPPAGDPTSPPAPGAPVDQPPAPQPSESVSPTPGDGVSAPASPSSPASPPEPTSPTPGQ